MKKLITWQNCFCKIIPKPLKLHGKTETNTRTLNIKNKKINWLSDILKQGTSSFISKVRLFWTLFLRSLLKWVLFFCSLKRIILQFEYLSSWCYGWHEFKKLSFFIIISYSFFLFPGYICYMRMQKRSLRDEELKDKEVVLGLFILIAGIYRIFTLNSDVIWKKKKFRNFHALIMGKMGNFN